MNDPNAVIRLPELLRFHDEMAEGVAAFRRDGTIRYANPAIRQLFTIPAGNPAGQCVWELFPQLVGTDFHRAFERVARTGRVERFEHWYERRWYWNELYRIGDLVWVLCREITEERYRRLRQTILSDAARTFATVVGGLDVTFSRIAEQLATTLGDGCAIRMPASDGAHFELLGLADRDPAVVMAMRAAPPERLDEGRVGRVFRTRQPLLASKLEPRPDEVVPVHSAIVCPLVIGDEAIGVLSVFRRVGGSAEPFGEADLRLCREVADLVAVAVARTRAEDSLRDANRRKDEFLAMLGHELRNPLAPITTALDLLRRRGADEVYGHELQVMARQVRHLVELVDDLLDVSRITRGQVRLRRERTDLGEVVARAIDMASPLLEQRAHALVVDVPRGLVLDADPGRIAQVVVNLLTNAAKYTERGGRIEVTAARDEGGVVVRVTDNGPGIGPALLPHIFEPFIQGTRTTDRAQGGLGLGLPIVRSLVGLHGGTVTVDSAPGRGSTFTVRLPLGGVEVPTMTPLPAVRVDGGRARRVLVVDDNVDAAALLRDLLVANGHTVQHAHDGPAALDAVARFTPDVALLDIGLPVMDGYELARRLRAVPGLEQVRLIAVTGYGQEEDRQESARVGFAAHLVKPIDLALLLRLLHDQE